MDGRGSQVWAKDGLGGFWRGNLTNTLSSAPGKAIDFFSYALFKEMFTKVREHSRGTSLQRGRRCETRHDQELTTGFPNVIWRDTALSGGNHRLGTRAR
jgi:hypothetical protein